MRRCAILLAALALPLVASAADGAQGDHVLYAWTEIAPTGVAPSGLVARAITDGAACPSLRTQAGTYAMRAVAPASGIVGFDAIRACRANVPGHTTRASIGAHRLPLLRRSGPIAIVGDTGCRMKKSHVQACADPQQWPWVAVANAVASTHPQFVLHVGDYLYREESCSSVKASKRAGCLGSPPINPAGSPNPDNWALWEADFFAPAAKLLAAAPLVPIRGNHESCPRAGNGYFLFLDPGGASPHTCGASTSGKLTRPYAVDANGLRLVVLDSSEACDFNSARPAWFKQTFGEAARLTQHGKTRWLVSHRPLWAFYANQSVDATEDSEGCTGASSPSPWANYELQVSASHLERYQAIVSGHLHAFEAVQIPGRPPQLVVGDGGTMLEGAHLPPATPPFHSKTPSYANGISAFGYALVEHEGAGWRLKLWTPGGDRLTTCDFGAAPMRCG